MVKPKTARPRADVDRARALFLERISAGATQADALAAVGRTRAALERWRQDDDFVEMLRAARASRVQSRKADPTIGFEEFSVRFLGQPLYRHQLQWLDLLEGRSPRDLHPAQTFESGEPNFIMINTPPEHAKSTTISVNYVTYRVVTDPNVRIILVSKTQERAKEFLYAVKQRLTHPRYKALQEALGPAGGWKADASVWSSDRVYLGGERDSGEKDPTIQAIGIQGQLYGARSDLIIIDDGIVLSNAHAFEAQLRWLQQEAITRLGPTGKLLVVGTRVDAMDLYRALREPERYPSGESPWTYLAQPAVLAYGESPKDWVTLWPRAAAAWSAAEVQGEDGLFARWDGSHLHRRRGMLNPRTWALAYMQQDVEEDSVFNAMKVRSCVNGLKQPGLMVRGAPGHRANGMEGLYVIGSMDPAMVGDTGVIVMGVDRHAKKRFVLDAKLKTAATPAWIRSTIKELTEKYSVVEWRIEKNAFQQYLTTDPEVTHWLASRGVRLHEHHTGRNKLDVGFGVASMSNLFDYGLIELPSTHLSEAVKQLVEQLIVWSPETKAKTDMVMSLWFAELRAREICQASALDPDGGTRMFAENRFLSRRARRAQQIINLNDLAAA